MNIQELKAWRTHCGHFPQQVQSLTVFSTKMGEAPTLNKEASFAAEGDHFQSKLVNM